MLLGMFIVDLLMVECASCCSPHDPPGGAQLPRRHPHRRQSTPRLRRPQGTQPLYRVFSKYSRNTEQILILDRISKFVLKVKSFRLFIHTRYLTIRSKCCVHPSPGRPFGIHNKHTGQFCISPFVPNPDSYDSGVGA